MPRHHAQSLITKTIELLDSLDHMPWSHYLCRKLTATGKEKNQRGKRDLGKKKKTTKSAYEKVINKHSSSALLNLSISQL